MKVWLGQSRWIIATLMVLILFGCAGRNNPAPVESVHVPGRGQSPRITGIRHKVKKGETLYSIAWRAGLDYRTVQNSIKLARLIRFLLIKSSF